jgi:molybdate transport system substrate-binding protein
VSLAARQLPTEQHWVRKTMLKQVLILALPALSVAISPALAVEITVLSGAAVEPGLLVAADAFRTRTGNNVKIMFATTPEIRRRVGAGETPDVVIAPPAALDELAKSGKVDGTARVPVGRVGVGVVVREGAPLPDVSTTEALKRALLDADTVIYNRASSGLFVEGLLQRLGLVEQIQAKTRRYAGTDMIEPLIKGKGKEIGFMPVAEILHFRGRGLVLVGPLPDDVQNYTSYAAAPASRSEPALAFVRFLGTPLAKSMFVAAGIE